MVSRRAVVALVLVQLIAFAVSAQQAAEFGRATGGELVLTPKNSAPLSGSLELSLTSGNDVFGRNGSPAYGVTAGGTLLQDRLWFFGSASRQEVSASRYGNLELPDNTATGAIGGRINGQLGAKQDFSAFFETARRPELSMSTSGDVFAGITPSSFLALRYDGLVSSNMSFSASFTRSTRTVPLLGIVPAQ
jgi:hypothetical protein